MAETRASGAYLYGYLLLVAIAVIAVSVITGNPVAGAIAGSCTVLSATWTAARYHPGAPSGPSEDA